MHSIDKTFFVLLLLSLAVLTGCKSSGSLDTPSTVSDNSGTNNTKGTLTITWDAPKTNTDGSPAMVAGYNIYVGTASGFYTAVSDVGNVTSHTVSDLSLTERTYYIAITAYDTSGNESDFSNEVIRTVP
jgi:hypothetical protein